MSASTASGLLNWVQSYLSTTVDGTGQYTYDLTAADAVTIAGIPTAGQISLGTQVFVVDESVTIVPGQPLTAWNQSMEIYLLGFVQGDGTSASLRRAALDLAADLTRAFRLDRVASSATILPGSSIHDVRTESETFDGVSLGYKGRGVVNYRVTITYRGDM